MSGYWIAFAGGLVACASNHMLAFLFMTNPCGLCLLGQCLGSCVGYLVDGIGPSVLVFVS